MTPSAGARPRRRGGFTLLEVLAAVAIFGIWFTGLAVASIGGLRSEGESERRMRASLLADRVLAELEAQTTTGIAPPVGNEESEREDFRVLVDVQAFDTSALLPPPEAGQEAPGSATVALLSALGDDANPVREIHVRVAWDEGPAEEAVTRTTYALDLQSLQPLLQSLAAAQNAGEGSSDAPPQPNPDAEDAAEGLR